MHPVQAAQAIEYHRRMLADSERLTRYREAIGQVVQPGDVVADLGTGSGILAFLACAAGAERVYAIDSGEVLAIARVLAQQNGLAERITFVAGSSETVELPEPVDVLVTETMGNLGVDEGMVALLADARKRLLREGGRVIPAEIAVHAAPVSLPDWYRTLDEWPADLQGVDLTSLRPLALNNVYRLDVPADALVAEGAPVLQVDLLAADGLAAQGEAAFTAARDAVVHGYAAWFDAGLAPGVRLTNAPGSTTHWGHAVFPLERPVEVSAGDPLTLRLDVRGEGGVWRWGDQSTVWGFPLARGA